MSNDQNSNLSASPEDKSTFLKAVEVVIANPEKIRNESISLLEKIRRNNPKKTDKEIREKTVDKIISNYSYYSAFSGGATALTGVVPGIGTAISMVGGAGADAVLSIKFQIEMTMAIATAYGHDILSEEGKRLCFMIAGLGAISEAAKEGGRRIGTQAFIKIVKQNLTGSTLVAVKEIFKKVGITFTQKAVTKAIPFGVGVVIGFSANKGLTLYVGHKAKEYFESDMDEHSEVDVTDEYSNFDMGAHSEQELPDLDSSISINEIQSKHKI